MLTKARIKYLRRELVNERISQYCLLEIETAFQELVERGVKLRDEPANAMASDMLDEIEDNLR